MRLDQRADAFKLAFPLVVPLFLSGCVMLPDQQDSRGVKLSDAMQASASGDHHDLGGSSSNYNYPEPGDSTPSAQATGDSGGGTITMVSYDKNEYDLQMVADTSYSLPINSQFESITHFTLTPLAYEDERNFLGIYVGGADVQLKSGSLADRATDRTWMLEAGLTYRLYLNSSRTALSPYLAASAGFTWLNWSYRSPVTADGETFQSDSLYGGEGTLAIGLSTRRDERVSFFGEAGIGGMFFAPVTVNGFDNDVFNDFGFLTFKAGLTVKF